MTSGVTRYWRNNRSTWLGCNRIDSDGRPGAYSPLKLRASDRTVGLEPQKDQ